MDEVQGWLEGLDEADRKEARKLLKTQDEYAHDRDLKWQEPFVVTSLDELNDKDSIHSRNPRRIRDMQHLAACPYHGMGRMGIVGTEGKFYCKGCNAESTARYKERKKDDPEFIRKRREQARRRYKAKKEAGNDSV